MTGSYAPPPPARTEGGAEIDEARNQVETDRTADLLLEWCSARDRVVPSCRRPRPRRSGWWSLREDLRLLDYDEAVQAGLIADELEVIQ